MQITKEMLEKEIESFTAQKQNAMNVVVQADAAIQFAHHLLAMLDAEEVSNDTMEPARD